MKRTIYLFLLFISAVCLHAQSPAVSATLETAAADYKKADYEGAVAAYENVIARDGASSGVLYNLGNSYTQLKEYGRARLCFERAAKLDPGSDCIENNLNYVASKVDIQNRSELKGKPLSVLPDDPWFFRSIYNMFALNVDSNTWATFAVIAFILFIALVADYIYTKQVWIRKVGFFGAIAMLGLTVMFLVFAFCARHEASSSNAGVIMASKVELLSSPSEKGKPVATPLNAGTKVEIRGTEGGSYDKPEWFNVHLNSDFSGWIKASDVEVI